MTFLPHQFQNRLLTWFDAHGRKTLPWQINKTPYRVWISEIMLQQTQVTTVIPYFERFMTRFPTLSALAEANEDEVLHLWTGLGYYSRARNLLRAAKLITEKHVGNLPDSLPDLTALPGIGRSTAGAILAIAFNQSVPILDGNVKRVLSRMHGILEPINQSEVETHLWELAARYTPTQRVGDYTQAIMDLGATLCTRQPACSHCPFRNDCQAYQHNTVALIPSKKTKRALPTQKTTLLVIRHANNVLLVRRPKIGVWANLFCLPELKGEMDIEEIQSFCQLKHWTIKSLQMLPSFKHSFSHYHLLISPVQINIEKPTLKVMAKTQQIWYNLRQPKAVGLPKPVLTILREQQ